MISEERKAIVTFIRAMADLWAEPVRFDSDGGEQRGERYDTITAIGVSDLHFMMVVGSGPLGSLRYQCLFCDEQVTQLPDGPGSVAWRGQLPPKCPNERKEEAMP